ncbi:hypothetical protein JCM11641_005415 [Rhodosporidiobolus odoratus]
MAGFDDLPPELVNLIVSLVTPQPPSFSTYAARVQALRSLETASEAFQHAVQHELFKVVSLTSGKEAACFLEAGQRHSKAFSTVAILYLSDQGDDDVQTPFEAVLTLRHLSLFSGVFTVSRPILLPRLVELSSFFSLIDKNSREHFVTPTSLPSLRHLALRHAPGLDPAQTADQPDYLLPDPTLLRQLVTVSHNDRRNSTSLKTCRPFLIDLPLIDSSEGLRDFLEAFSGSALHVRLYHPAPRMLERLGEKNSTRLGQMAVDVLVALFPPTRNSGVATLKSLYLPAIFAKTPQFVNLGQSDSGGVDGVNPLAAKVEVVYEDTFASDSDTLISPAFVAWVEDQ